MPLRRSLPTKHEGRKLYTKHWNFWTRVDGEVENRAASFFRAFDSQRPPTLRLLRDIGFPNRPARTEREIWERIGMLWSWCRTNVRVDNDAYGRLSSDPNDWPSLDDHAAYYARHRKLVWAACFAKAHLFAGLLGRLFYPADRIALAHAHHREGGAPPTATHVYVAVYVADAWYYIDPSAVSSADFPPYEERRSVGHPDFTTVDYAHPYKVTPLPGSTLTRTPLLEAP